MQTTELSPSTPPLFLATSRGFYCGCGKPTANYLCEAEGAVFTSNIRNATTFATFQELEDCFQLLKIVNRKMGWYLKDYFAATHMMVVASAPAPVISIAEE